MSGLVRMPNATTRAVLLRASVLAVAATAMLAGCAAREHRTSAISAGNPSSTHGPSATTSATISTTTVTDTSATAEESPAPRSESTTSEPAVPAAPVAEPQFIQCTPQIRVDRAHSVLEVAVVSVLEVGFLEQYVCSPSTREHESLFVFEGKASELHAALLLAGFKPGAPGSWREVPPPEGQPNDGNQQFAAVPPTGDAIRITAVLPDGTEHPLTHFVRASPLTPNTDARPPNDFVFAGSRFRADRRTGVERYLADGSGSIIGLVTFGDETIAAVEVVPDQISVAPPVWEAFTERMPKPGTKLMLRITRAAAVSNSTSGTSRTSPRRRRRREARGQIEATRQRAPSKMEMHEHVAPPAARSNGSKSEGQIKRPGRDRASGRALPGARWEVGVCLPRTQYTRLRFSQGTFLRSNTGLSRDRAFGEDLFSPFANAVTVHWQRPRPGISRVVRRRARSDASSATSSTPHPAGRVALSDPPRSRPISQWTNRPPRTSA